jgi:hypothetical protein
VELKRRYRVFKDPHTREWVIQGPSGAYMDRTFRAWRAAADLAFRLAGNPVGFQAV